MWMYMWITQPLDHPVFLATRKVSRSARTQCHSAVALGEFKFRGGRVQNVLYFCSIAALTKGELLGIKTMRSVLQNFFCLQRALCVGEPFKCERVLIV